MKRIKDVVHAMPERKTDEGGATDGQIVWLRGTGYFSEALLRDLGVGQAGYLMEHAAEIQASDENADGGRARRGAISEGGGGGVKLLVLLVVLGVAGYFFYQRWGGSVAELPRVLRVNPVEVAAEPTKVEESAPPSSAPAEATGEADETVRESGDANPRIMKFAGMAFPARLVVMEDVSMLDASGKETALAAGSEVTVSARGGKGTLTIESGGKVYVGNEARLVGKVAKDAGSAE